MYGEFCNAACIFTVLNGNIDSPLARALKTFINHSLRSSPFEPGKLLDEEIIFSGSKWVIYILSGFYAIGAHHVMVGIVEAEQLKRERHTKKARNRSFRIAQNGCTKPPFTLRLSYVTCRCGT